MLAMKKRVRCCSCKGTPIFMDGAAQPMTMLPSVQNERCDECHRPIRCKTCRSPMTDRQHSNFFTLVCPYVCRKCEQPLGHRGQGLCDVCKQARVVKQLRMQLAAAEKEYAALRLVQLGTET